MKIVIIGGGFGGVFAAKNLVSLAKKRGLKEIQVELVSERNYFVFHPLLPEVSAGTINAQDAVTPLRLLLPGVRIRLAEVTNIDFDNKQVHILQGQKKLIQRLSYDQLVIGSGQVTDLSLFSGFDQHSMTMKDISDAYSLRNHVIRCLEMADVTRFDDIKKRALTFVVAGGGFSGVETMGELVEMIRRTLRFYPNIDVSEIRPILIQRGKQLLPEMNAKLGEYALRALQKRGVDVRLQTGISSATLHCVTTAKEEKIEAMTIVTTVGNGPSAFVKKIGLQLNRGKIEVDENLQVKYRENLWALGDIALIPMNAEPDSSLESNPEQLKYAPPTAQFAVQEAKYLARNIIAEISNKPLQPFAYKPKGMLASLGNYQGVAEIFGMNIKGLLAWLIWRALYIGMLPGFPTRLRVALNWLFDYFLPRTIVQMADTKTQAIRYQYYNSGDIILDENQVVSGFYVLVSGRLDLTVTNHQNGDVFQRQLLPGDHLGEQLLTKGMGLSTCKLKAEENSKVLVMQADDFLRFRESFPGFRQLLQ